jgi:phage terminase Nu1 subunit (DNA packaging protein)
MSTSRPRGQTITVSQAAALLGRSDRWVQGLVKAGYIERANRGEYTLVAVIRGALAYYEDQITKNNKAAAATRASEARTREIELRIQDRSRELIAMEDARAVIGEMAALVRAELAGLPSSFSTRARGTLIVSVPNVPVN